MDSMWLYGVERMSFTCPECKTELALALAVATPNPARPRGSEAVDNFAPVAPAVAHIGLEVVGSESQTKTKAQRRKLSYSARFEEFWQEYPVHRDKAKAQVAFTDAIFAGEDVYEIIAGAKRYARWLPTTTTAPKYAQGWLNDRRWEDELDMPASVGETDPAYILGTPEYAARMQAEEDAAIEAMS